MKSLTLNVLTLLLLSAAAALVWSGTPLAQSASANHQYVVSVSGMT